MRRKESRKDRWPDAEALLLNGQRLHDEATRVVAGSTVEFFHRFSLRVRASLTPPDTRARFIETREEGLAIRLDHGARGYSFVACSGGGEAALHRALFLVGRALPQVKRGGELWAIGTGGTLLDLEPCAALPTFASLASWLETAIGLGAGSAERSRAILGSAWVEAGLTVETLVADGGLAASRCRGRAWALAMARRQGPDPFPERPLILAARNLEELPVDGWAKPLDQQVDAASSGRLRAGTALVVGGGAAASLVASLAGSFHGYGCAIGRTVGRAWKLRDDPLEAAGLAGGRFDDTGFPTRPLVLADGRTTLGSLGTRGHYRRPSFRDPPAPMFSTLIVEERHDPMPSKAFRAHGLRVHRLAPDRWVLDLEGVQFERGRPIGSFERLRQAVRPADLLAGCRRSIGPAALHANGVATPTLVFEGLRFD
jgi:hypothetical protein